MKHQKDGTCPICDTGTYQPLFRATPLDYSQRKVYQMLVCTKCGHGVSNVTDRPIEEQIEAYNKGAYDPREKLWHRLIKPFLEYLELRKLRYIGRKGSGKRLLEIGCGKGRFLANAQSNGYEVFGIEPSTRSAVFARKRLGQVIWSVEWAKMNEVEPLNQQFDGIYLWHVLEHLTDPNGALKTFRQRLKPNGSLVIAVPNFGSTQARQGAGDWYHLDPSRHHQHFTPGSLQRLFERNGYKVRQKRFNSLYQDYVGELITIVNKILPDKNVLFNVLRLNQGYIGSVGWPRALVMFGSALLLSTLLALPLLLWTILTQLFGKSGTMVFVAQPLVGANA